MAWDTAGHQSAQGELVSLPVHHLFSFLFFSFSISPLLNKQALSQPTSFLVFSLPFVFPCPTGAVENWASGCVVLCFVSYNPQQWYSFVMEKGLFKKLFYNMGQSVLLPGLFYV